MLPGPPTSYAATVEIANVTLTWVNGANATQVIHEVSYDGGVTYNRLDHDEPPTVTSDHSLNQDATAHLRAKSTNASGESAYCTPVVVQTGNYNDNVG